MTIGSILLALALLIFALLFIFHPILRRGEVGNEGVDRGTRLRQSKEALIRQIQQLDGDYLAGAMPQDIYGKQRAALVSKAAQTLRQLDRLAPATGQADEAGIEAEIEAAVMRLRQVAPVAPRNYCPSCGQPVQSDDNFCASCGHRLTLEARP